MEQAFLKVDGQWLQGSGWTAPFVDANLVTLEKADSFLKFQASHADAELIKLRQTHIIFSFRRHPICMWMR